MPMRHGQRKHIINSLDGLLYQLHTLSFILSPAFWPYLLRVVTQFQFSRPREIDSKRSLRFWFFLIFFYNFGSVWGHAAEGAQESRSVVLDFVGMAYLPSRLHLLCLDALIIVLEMVLTTVAFETSLSEDMPSDTPDPLLPIPEVPSSTIPLAPMFDHTKPSEVSSDLPHIIDLRLSFMIDRLRHPPPPAPEREPSAENLLPLPGSTPFQLSRSLRALMQARARVRTRAAEGSTQDREQTANGLRRIPGGLDTEDGE